MHARLTFAAIVGSLALPAAAQCYPPSSPTAPRCYEPAGAPLVAIAQQFGQPKWQGLMPDGTTNRFVLLYENDSCWHVVEWKVGTAEYCVTRAGPSRAFLEQEVQRRPSERK